MEDVEGYVKVIKTTEGYQFKVKVNGSTIEKNNYCCDEVDIEEFGNNLGKCQTVDKTYAVGDKISFAGSNWYVINASSAEEDYVTVMKERVLTNSELGDYACDSGYDTMIYHESSNIYSTSKIKEMLENRYLSMLGESNLKEIKVIK